MSDDDHDSLFGSPPPSPTGRGRSPPLALPGSVNQNVGTIALFGLHNSFSESSAAHLASAEIRPSPARARPQNSRTSSQNSLTPPSGPPPARPLAPVLDFPESGSAPPRQLLRSHPSLLGVAGTVAQVDTSRLRVHYPHGTGSSSNPIDLDADTPTPTARNQRPLRLPFPPSRIQNACTSSRDILSQAVMSQLDKTSLSSQSELSPTHIAMAAFLRRDPRFPSILKGLIGFIATPKCSQTSTSPSTPPPSKRVKLRHVPAGADHWDVPYPFLRGEGPEKYQESWAAQRRKQLLLELSHLLRDAYAYVKEKTEHASTRQAKPLQPSNGPPHIPTPARSKSYSPESVPAPETPEPFVGGSIDSWLSAQPSHSNVECSDAVLEDIMALIQSAAGTSPSIENFSPHWDTDFSYNDQYPSFYQYPDIQAFPLFDTQTFPDSPISQCAIDPMLCPVPTSSSNNDWLFGTQALQPPQDGIASPITSFPSTSTSSGVTPDAVSYTDSPPIMKITLPSIERDDHSARQFASSSANITKRNSTKSDVLAKAKLRRQTLVREIEKAKLELWGCTIEAGVLKNLQSIRPATSAS
ncbi:hypothetical protein SISNIDRAFT_490410 [Sistotremastrum niveocremeum HHB9708]|uniref:Uncharacterized protein n=2 Tax=Sistotremastraceae TaxID=3402574 RepID=A0A164NUK4_9AGAM|nr:hypothetical protein SISNIDRAFT_490410 [Sistotremastrum niveocremeum HHB9708]